MTCITIDGLSGVGKGAVSRQLANDLNFTYLSIGLIFRAVAWVKVYTHNDLSSIQSMIKINLNESKEPRIFLYHQDITDHLFGDVNIESEVPLLAMDPKIQTQVYSIIRTFCEIHHTILEGRIANKIMPDAILKILLWAEPTERANRNYAEYLRIGKSNQAEELLLKVRKRDQLDLSRDIDPLRYKTGMIAWDSSSSTFAETVNQINRYIKHYMNDIPFTVSVIIPVKDRENHLYSCLKHLAQQDIDKSLYEIIVVDDNSSDNSVKIAEKYSDKVIISDGKGPAYARNLGLQVAKGDFIIFVDSDILVQEDFIRQHIQLHELNNKLIVIGARRHLPKDQNKLDIHLSRKDSREVLLSLNSMDLNYLAHPWSIAYTCNVSGPRRLFLDNLFDTDFYGWGLEDIEWAYRLHHKGVRWAFSSRAAGYHLWHDREMTDYKFLQWKNNLNLFLRKHTAEDAKKFRLFETVFDPKQNSDYMEVYSIFQSNSLRDVLIVDISAINTDHLLYLQDYVYRQWNRDVDLIILDSKTEAERYNYEISIGISTGYEKNIRFFTICEWNQHGHEVIEQYNKNGFKIYNSSIGVG